MLVPEAHGAHKACDIYIYKYAINDVAIVSIRIFVCIHVYVCMYIHSKAKASIDWS
jgi:hypothetical protein